MRSNFHTIFSAVALKKAQNIVNFSLDNVEKEYYIVAAF